MADDKFLQPVDGIEIERGSGPAILLSQEVLRKAAERIKAGEDRAKVILELAFEQVELEEGMREDGLLPELEVPEKVLRGAEFDPDQPRDDHGRWTDSGSGVDKLQEIADGRKFYPLDQPNKLFKTLTPTDREAYLKDFKVVPEARKAGATEREMDITDLVATQKSVEVAQVKELIEDPSLADDPEDGPPLLVTWQGRLLVGDGHHRISAALLRGERKMQVEYVDLDSYLRKLRGAEFNPDQARDDHGRWTDGGGSSSGTITSDDDLLGELGAQGELRFRMVERRSKEIAAQMGVSPSIIHVVHKEPRAFTVGNQQFHEAGHYDPRTGMIEINVQGSYDDRMSVTNGIAAHEVSHAIYDAARLAQQAEHKEISDLSEAETKRLFRASGYVRPEFQAEVHERWPVSAMFYRHLGDPYMETEDEQRGGSRYIKKTEQLAKDDGVSDYSRSYWQEDLLKQSGGTERAVNETLAETVRHQMAEGSWSGNAPHETWRAWAEDLRKIAAHPKVKARIGRRP